MVKNTLQPPFVSLDVRKDRLENVELNVHALVAELDGRDAGNIALICGHSRLAHSASLGMTVRVDFQGQGICTELMVALMGLAENWLNHQRIEFQVYTHNEPGIALYEKFGFEIEGTHRDHALRDGLYAQSYTMARLRL